ncbi:phosphoribosylglycinamide formyltransferase [Aquiluna sp.]|nr:phosphoribosylglycinamide formyltransferase [Aquiluna sp.]MDA9010459.1 phosphoribosylglycinamide formyltransferase [Aquiluna sp.]
MFSVVVLVSGAGSNLRALLEASASPLYPAKVVAVGSDRAALALEHAEEFGVPTFVVEPAGFHTAAAWAQVLLSNVESLKPDLIVLAGFMKVLPANFVNALSPRIINLHPSLLPEFRGAHAVRDALAAGATKTGATIHIVDEGVDTGRILLQQEVEIPGGISEPELLERIQVVERQQLIEAIKMLATGEITL